MHKNQHGRHIWVKIGMMSHYQHTRPLFIKKIILIAGCCYLLFSTPVFSWNALGHRLIAQVAYDQLTPQVKRILNRYNRAVDKGHKSIRLVNAAVWLDSIRYQRNDIYAGMHYINLSFSEDGTPLPLVSEINAITGIKQSIFILGSEASDYNKGIALRVLLHVVGDIHQPMHATSRVSHRYPDGDRGGNDVELSKNPIAKNLHAYWDKGAGYLDIKPQKKHRLSIKKMAAQLEHDYPCNTLPLKVDPEQWAKESHEIGIGAYQSLYHNNPDFEYQSRSIKIVKMRIALAGCRLGAILGFYAQPPPMFPSDKT